MEANLDDYFWMIDRLGMEDNQKNKVDNEKNTVVLDKMLTGSIANGYYMAKLIVEMHSTYLKRTRKKFTLDPAISNVKDNLQKKTKEANWFAVARQLSKFGVTLDNESVDQIISKNNVEIVSELISQLAQVD